MGKVENRFNLVEENWIPVADEGSVSLRRIFSDSGIRALGGNPVQKIAVTKLLLAICQTSYTPEDDGDWARLGPDGMAEKATTYLERKKDLFWLYGDKPFLQMPTVEAARMQPFGAVLPSIATGNTTVLTQSQFEVTFKDAEIALLVVEMMGLALGGKKTDNKVVLSPGYRDKSNPKGNAATGRPGPSVGYLGYLHTFLLGDNILSSLWLNLMTSANIMDHAIYPDGIGTAPWESMPEGEDCATARKLKNSLMGRLIPMSRFVLLGAEGLHYTEGIAHPSYKDGVVDPSMSVDYSGKDPKILWVNPEKRPWRELTAMISFVEEEHTRGFSCALLNQGLLRSRDHVSRVGIWSGGLRVSSNAGEQYASGADDFVESKVFLPPDLGASEFALLRHEMGKLDELSATVFGRVAGFYRDQKSDGKKTAAHATNRFWQLCERQFQSLVYACGDSHGAKVAAIRPIFARIVQNTYDAFCPRATARQIDAWANNRPELGRYLKMD